MVSAIYVNQVELALWLQDNGAENRVLSVNFIHGQVRLPCQLGDLIDQDGGQICASALASRLIEHGRANLEIFP